MTYVNALGRSLRESSPSTRWVTADQPGQTLTGTALNETLTGGAGHTLIGGEGDDIYGLTGPAVIREQEGGGIDTMSVWASATLPAHVENLVMNGGYGWYAIGNELDNIISGTGGRQQIDGGPGNDVLIGGDGDDLFVVHRGNGSDLIVDFGRGADQIRLSGYGLHTFEDVLAIARQNGSNVVLDLIGGEILVLQNVRVSELEARDFLLEVDLSRYTRTFSDEFDRLDLSITGGTWDTFYSHNDSTDLRSRFHAGESQIYVDPLFAGTSGRALGLNPFSISDGILTITAAPATAAMLPHLGNQTYTSGLLTTASSFAQQYGYFEVRAALPEGQGFWPAFWLLPEDGSWPPEIDVFEMLGRDPDTFYYSTHTVEDGRHVVETRQYHVDTTQFHVYGVDWGPQTITFYLDGVAIGQVPTPASMHRPFYMLLNLAVGGTWGGDPDHTTGTGPMQIDYVRAWRTADTAPITGDSGNNVLRGGPGNDILDGRAGMDTADYAGVRRQYTASSTSVSGNAEGTDRLISIEQVRFVDGILTFDASSASAQVMRLYSATLNRAPDQVGLEANVAALATLGLQGLANSFVASTEFQARFGALNNQQFVEQLYVFALGRTGDAPGIASWVALLNGGTSRGQVVMGFSESAENIGRTAATLNAGLWVPDQQAQVIARLYDATFDRLPDVDGLASWVNALKAGTSLTDIAAAFAGSAEFQARYGALSNQAFVEQLYRFCLNREGDPGGIAGWVNALNNGTSRASVLLSFSESAEHIALTANFWLGGIRFAGFVGAPAEDVAKDDGPQVLPDVEVIDTAYDPADLGLSFFEKGADAFVLPAVPDMPLPTVDPAQGFDGLHLAALRATALSDGRMMLILPDAPGWAPAFDLDALIAPQRDGHWLI